MVFISWDTPQTMGLAPEGQRGGGGLARFWLPFLFVYCERERDSVFLFLNQSYPPWVSNSRWAKRVSKTSRPRSMGASLYCKYVPALSQMRLTAT